MSSVWKCLKFCVCVHNTCIYMYIVERQGVTAEHVFLKSFLKVLMCAFSKQFGVLLACFSTIDFHTIFTASAWLTPDAHTNTHTPTNTYVCSVAIHAICACCAACYTWCIYLIHTNERTEFWLYIWARANTQSALAQATTRAPCAGAVIKQCLDLKGAFAWHSTIMDGTHKHR